MSSTALPRIIVLSFYIGLSHVVLYFLPNAVRLFNLVFKCIVLKESISHFILQYDVEQEGKGAFSNVTMVPSSQFVIDYMIKKSRHLTILSKASAICRCSIPS